jgi:hypothetical protein
LFTNLGNVDLPKNLLKLEKVRFTHSLHADDNGTIYGKFRDDDLHYVGTPSPEIDANWEYLVGGKHTLEVCPVRFSSNLSQAATSSFTTTKSKR